MQHMTAFVLPDAGSGVIEAARVPVPQVGPNGLLVRVRAVGVGIHDSYFLPPEMKFPYPIGIEGAGIVGPGVVGYQPGDRIAFVSMVQAKGGVWAE